MSYPGKAVSIALVHWPVLDRAGNTVVTNVTNFDIHDIARVTQTYGLQNYYIVNRLKEQLMYVHRVLDHWKVGPGRRLNPMRRTALGRVALVETIEDLLKAYPEKPTLVATAARDLTHLPQITFRELKSQIEEQSEAPLVLLFGTGFGLHDEALELCDYVLEPICSQCPEDYRHLSVRSAVSICLDRLLSKW